MQLFPLLKKVQLGLVEEHQKTRPPIIRIGDHLLKVLIQPPLENRNQEIIVQDLMINPTKIIY
tara:strand:+ start:356 stop:544 length:189 start_codon:yes stop_codon:yes gene_type:complete